MHIDLPSLLTHELKIDPKAFSGKTIVVTGAGRGIGFQTARAFAILGGNVVLAELSDQGKEAESKIRKEDGNAHFIPTDVSDPDSVKDLAKHVQQSFGHVDVLINNAIYIHQSSVTEMALDAWDQTIAVNLRGTFLTCRAFLPGMLKTGGGTILNMISTDAMPGLSAYIASKQGITGFTQSLALEVQETGVRVVPFGPGMVDTPGIRSISKGLAPRLGLTEEELLNLSLHAAYEGLMPPEHAAAAAVYLTLYLSEEFHGQIVTGYEILEKAGVIKTNQTITPSPYLQLDKTQQALVNDLAEILKMTELEFNQLPIFVRPMAKQGFKHKAGSSLSDWQRLIGSIASDLLSVPPDLIERLKLLAQYYREVPKETARFTSDEETLKLIAEKTNTRLSVIEALNAKLKE